MHKNLFLVLVLATLLFSCKSTPKFVGSWELDSLQLENETITALDLGNPVYTFNEDNSYIIEVTGLAQNGTWDLKDDKLTLTDLDNPDAENVLTIIEVNDVKFHYTAGDGNSVTNVILKRKE